MATTSKVLPRNGEGTKAEIARATRVARAAAKAHGAELDEFFVAGHTHEGMNPGGVSINYGGVFDWPCTWSQTPEAQALAAKMGVEFGAINYTTLGVYRAG